MKECCWAHLWRDIAAPGRECLEEAELAAGIAGVRPINPLASTLQPSEAVFAILRSEWND
jgi:hypothetical protein